MMENCGKEPSSMLGLKSSKMAMKMETWLRVKKHFVPILMLTAITELELNSLSNANLNTSI